MALTVLVRLPGAGPAPSVTFDAPRIVVGRGESCEVCLPDPSVSHRHASIRQQGNDWVVLDEGSTNGTFVGLTRLSPQAPRVLRSGDLVRVGRVWLEVRIEHAPASTNPSATTREIALGIVAVALARQGEAAAVRVRVVGGPDLGQELTLAEIGRPYVIGRTKGVDLLLSDEDVSRRHIEIVRRGDRIVVRDLGSKNGAMLGDVHLEPSAERPWPPGVELAIGATRLAYDDPVRDALEELERAADERMKDEEVVEVPSAKRDDEDEDAEETKGIESGPRAKAPSRADAEPASRPAKSGATRPSRRAPKAPSGGWTGTDFIVALVALAVLGLSVVALLWLLKSG